MRSEGAAGDHPVVRSEHLIGVFAGGASHDAARSLVPRMRTAESVDDLASALEALPDDVDFAIVQFAGGIARAAIAGARLALKVDRTDGTVVLFGAPPRPRWSIVTETECAAIEIVDVAAVRDDSTLVPLDDRLTSASRIVLRRSMETTTEALPPIASLSFADGRVIDVHGGPLVLGRSPRAVRIDGASIPRLVPLEAAGPAVSRAHARIDVIAGRLSIEDLDSRNGTAVIDPIGGSRRLRPGERVPLVDGMVVTIAQDLAFRVIAS